MHKQFHHGTQRLQQAVEVAAMAHRRALKSAREGSVVEDLFYRLLAPNQ